MKEQISEKLEQLRLTFWEVSQHIGHNPELGHEEFIACKTLTDLLKSHGFTVEVGTCGLETAFTATFDSGQPGPKVGFMAEYDALPQIGHACGHNLIGTMSAAAAIGLSDVLHKTGGKIYVYGTPAEETRGAKVTMADAGLFDDLDVAMMVHPNAHYEESGTSLAMDAIQFDFFGKAAHAAASPHEGINALDAVIATFNQINALRQHVTPDVRIHGIIPEGGQAANVVPDFARAQFYVRAASRKTLQPLLEKVKNCAKAAALATGAQLEISFYEFSYDDMNTNEALSKQFTANLVALGVGVDDIREKTLGGSLDMGNVSQRVPAIHPYVKITDGGYACHTPEFRDAALSEQGFEGLMLGAKTMAHTAFDVLTDQALLETIKQEYKTWKEKQ
ncbi:M20 family metallopeptidase [Shouchella clausii]|uniref:Peptidase M20 domain-containing protein 2 n=1 Tax=Shouchella rhizosphaerae TaxID=866786 RepID=A0ABZ2CQP4_9BACI|nr:MULTISPECIES: M20 family metallopeptidase [Shouchella]ALA51224.1 Catalyzes the cleavage of p-aminobenzoyl-glutamate to p-aminobenzoate and glutamate, subunit A [Shouchella clausii]MBU3232645.1 M20 family metallopeptidase [Shouchella clausii]MBU3265542.1 M20 family metallopeptidase [Shouchella clausii]MBU3508629.1 M20 family metallopeptidase [Shouchella clausii]MBU3536660.1 M20 family metallopeptidase [Shouchella clausii]